MSYMSSKHSYNFMAMPMTATTFYFAAKTFSCIFLFFSASKINSSWIALETSRGIESYHHKLFMRYTVLVVDLFVLFPAFLLFYFEFCQKNASQKTCFFLILILYYPGLVLIDHGHFQYNNFSLGLMAWSLWAYGKQRDVAGSVFFCLALNYKQMELYHALPVFFYLLGKAFSRSLLQW